VNKAQNCVGEEPDQCSSCVKHRHLLSVKVSDHWHQTQSQQQQWNRDRREIPSGVPASAAIVVVADDLIGQRAVGPLALVADDNRTDTPECSDKHITLTARTAVCNAVHFVQTLAAITCRLYCTAC